MKVKTAFPLVCIAILLSGCVSKRQTTAAAAHRRPVMRFTDPEKQQKIIEEKIKVKIFALETLAKEKPLVLQLLTDVAGKPSLTNTLKQADAARAAIQRDQTYLDALNSFYLALSNRQRAVTAELNVYHAALTNHPAAVVTNLVLKSNGLFRPPR